MQACRCNLQLVRVRLLTKSESISIPLFHYQVVNCIYLLGGNSLLLREEKKIEFVSGGPFRSLLINWFAPSLIYIRMSNDLSSLVLFPVLFKSSTNSTS